MNEQTQQRVTWGKNLPVKLYVHSSVPTNAYPALTAAINEYNTELGRTMFQVEAWGVGGPLSPQKDGYSTIYWYTTWSGDPPNEEGVTEIYWAGHNLYQADIIIDAYNFTYNYTMDSSIPNNNIDLASVFLHELGHVLGLAHVPNSFAVMYAILNFGQIRRLLTPIDINNLKCGYSI